MAGGRGEIVAVIVVCDAEVTTKSTPFTRTVGSGKPSPKFTPRIVSAPRTRLRPVQPVERKPRSWSESDDDLELGGGDPEEPGP